MEVFVSQVELEGEVVQPEISHRYFKTLDSLADYIRVFKVQGGSFGFGNIPDIGECYVLEYDARKGRE